MDSVKFALFTDLHYDHIPDGNRRLQGFIDKIKDTEIDFIIGLGDICYPIEENRVIMEALNKRAYLAITLLEITIRIDLLKSRLCGFQV